MFGFIKRKIAKIKLIWQLESKAYSQEMNAAYDEQVIDDLKEKIAGHRKEIELLDPQIKELEGSHERDKREAREELKSHKAEREKIIVGIENMISQTINAASNERQQAAQARHRAAFIRKKY